MRYRYCKETKKMVPYEPRPSSKAHHVIPDIEPYKAISGDRQGQMITSRSEHREFLRRNNFVEVGNEKAYFDRHGGMSPDNPNVMSERKHEERICQDLTRNLQKLQSR